MLKATLDRYNFAAGEFGRIVTYKIYNEDTQPFNLTDYTVTLIGAIQLATTPDVGSGGTGTFVFTSSTNLTSKGKRQLRFLLERSGEKSYSRRISVLVE